MPRLRYRQAQRRVPVRQEERPICLEPARRLHPVIGAVLLSVQVACVPWVDGAAVCRVGPEGTGAIVHVPASQVRLSAQEMTVRALATLQAERGSRAALARPRYLPVGPEPPPSRLSSYFWHAPGHIGDLVSTEVGLSRGARELNPLMQTTGARIAVKALMITAVAEVDYRLSKRKSHKALWVLRGVGLAATSAAIVHNLNQGE